MIVLALAAALFVFFTWSLFRLAMGLRESRRVREEARSREEAEGRRVIAEIPLDEGILFFVDDGAGFAWGAQRVARADIAGARLLLNRAVLSSWSEPGATLPGQPSAEGFEGRERWDVVLYLRDGRAVEVPCGILREGVSREIGSRIFEATRPA